MFGENISDLIPSRPRLRVRVPHQAPGGQSRVLQFGTNEIPSLFASQVADAAEVIDLKRAGAGVGRTAVCRLLNNRTDDSHVAVTLDEETTRRRRP